MPRSAGSSCAAAENSVWGYCRIHGEVALLGITVAPSTVWEILKTAGIEPSPQRTTVTWAAFLRSQAEAILAIDFIETVTLTGQRQYLLAAIHHAGRRVRVLGITGHPTHAWVRQAVRNLVMDLARRCAHLPLALRVASERVAAHPHLTVADLVQELDAEVGGLDSLSRWPG